MKYPHSRKLLKWLIRFSSISTCLIISSFSFCTDPDKTDEVKDSPRNLKNKTSGFIYNVIPNDPNASITPQYSTAINTFSVNLLREVCKGSQFKNKNVVLSPFSVSRSLAVVTEGATGESKSELMEALGGQTALDDARDALSELLYADNSVILQCADAFWINSSKYSLNQSFKEKVNTKFGVEFSGLDFSNTTGAVNTINSWISANTNNYLQNVLGKDLFNPGTAFVLTNAVYFEADWTSPFDITRTQPESFSSPDGDVSVEMMSSDYLYKTRKTSVYENAKVFYGTLNTGFFYLDIYMPVTVSIDDFLQNGCLTALSDNDSTVMGTLNMPKFTFKSDVDLIPVLKSLGVKEIFNPGNQDLSGIVQSKDNKDSVNIYIDVVKHVAGIENDEEGTKAYAVTVITGAGSAGPVDPGVVLNKPFVYFVRAGQNGLVLFGGVVNNPNEK